MIGPVAERAAACIRCEFRDVPRLGRRLVMIPCSDRPLRLLEFWRCWCRSIGPERQYRLSESTIVQEEVTIEIQCVFVALMSRLRSSDHLRTWNRRTLATY